MTSGKPAILKDGRRVQVRDYSPHDKEALISMYASLSQESLRWSLPPYNRARIERWISNPENSIILLVVDGDRVVGHLQISVGTSSRFLGIGELFVYLHQDYQNVGLGKVLMDEALSQARRRHLHRIELTVVTDNERGIHLYEKAGFQREGVKRENFMGDDGKYHDEVVMGILL
ncbi:MAG TPA: GNAT family N-acetyltransferase [Candidatus Bathyarchaeia archaeon]|nr:GNAT family N-acetyltransferase [Candidatus Bathyarchaeia archaeon]